jgi:hypothetical protein
MLPRRIVVGVRLPRRGRPPGPGDVPEPADRELRALALRRAAPFVGFGMMDNSVLILSGEAIDINLGAALGISTMCAAAVGNIGADLCGLAFGTAFATRLEGATSGRLALPPMPRLTREQRDLRSVRVAGQIGRAGGLTLGCVIGMFPLLFFPRGKGGEDAHEEDEEDDATSPTPRGGIPNRLTNR